MLVAFFFFLLLSMGIPIAFVVLVASTAGIWIYSGTSLQIVIQTLYSGLNNYILLAIPFFIMSGAIAAKGNTSKYLIKVMRLFFGRLYGGSLIGAILACTFFAAISGSSIATIIAIGGLVIPAMLEEGYPDRMPIGVVTAGGSLGILIPPSAPMIGLCVAMGTSVSALFAAGFIPVLLLAAVWITYALIASRKMKVGRREVYSFKESMKIILKAIPALLFPGIVLGGIYLGWATPTEAAAVSVIYVILIELFIYKTIKVNELFETLYKSLVTSATMTFIVACAAIITWFVTTQQVPAMINNFITSTVSSKTAFMLLLFVLFFIVGCFMDLFAMLIILAPILAPTLAGFDINPIHFGIICIMTTQIAFLTPPFGLNLFVSMGLTKKGLWETSYATMPYTILLAIVTLLIMFVPQITLWLPSIMK